LGAGDTTGAVEAAAKAVNAAVAGAWFHAQAGVAAEKNIGQNISVMAGDVVRQIPNALK